MKHPITVASMAAMVLAITMAAACSKEVPNLPQGTVNAVHAPQEIKVAPTSVVAPITVASPVAKPAPQVVVVKAKAGKKHSRNVAKAVAKAKGAKVHKTVLSKGEAAAYAKAYANAARANALLGYKRFREQA